MNLLYTSCKNMTMLPPISNNDAMFILGTIGVFIATFLILIENRRNRQEALDHALALAQIHANTTVALAEIKARGATADAAPATTSDDAADDADDDYEPSEVSDVSSIEYVSSDDDDDIDPFDIVNNERPTAARAAIRRLIKTRPHVLYAIRDNSTFVSHALAHGHVDVVFDVLPVCSAHMHVVHATRGSLLVQAIRLNTMAGNRLAACLLERFAVSPYLGAAGKYMPAMSVAVEVGNAEAITLLMNHGVNPYVPDYLGRSALEKAALDENVELLTLMITTTAHHGPAWRRAMATAIHRDNLEMVKALRPTAAALRDLIDADAPFEIRRYYLSLE